MSSLHQSTNPSEASFVSSLTLSEALALEARDAPGTRDAPGNHCSFIEGLSFLKENKARQEKRPLLASSQADGDLEVAHRVLGLSHQLQDEQEQRLWESLRITSATHAFQESQTAEEGPHGAGVAL